jgi:hypothetical protein
MALSTKSFKPAPAADRGELIRQRELIDARLTETDEAERLRNRQQWASELAKLTLVDDGSIKRLTADVKAKADALDEARRVLRVAEGRRTAQALANQSRSAEFANNLLRTASPQIPRGIAELQRKIALANDKLQNRAGGFTNGASIATFVSAAQAAQRQLNEWRLLPLDETELETKINRLFRSLPPEKFPLVGPPEE